MFREHEIYSLIIFLVCISENFGKILGESSSCVNSRDSSNYANYECRFSDTNASVLRCDELARARDYAPFISFPFYVHTLYVFEVSDHAENFEKPFDNSVSRNSSQEGPEIFRNKDVGRCLMLRRIVQNKIYLSEPWKNVSVTHLEPFFLFLLVGARNMNWDSSYTSEDPVGYVRLNTTCFEHSTDPTTCIKEVKVSPIVTVVKKLDNAYFSEYWEKLRMNRLDILKQSYSSLSFEIDPTFNVSTSVYLKPFFNSTGLHQLRTSGSHWGDMEHLLNNLTDLVMLDISNNDISSIDTENFISSVRIEDLNLADNNLTGVPDGIKSLKNLRVFDISGNPLHLGTREEIDNFTKILQNHPNLTSLSLSHVPLKSMHPLHQLLCRLSENGDPILKLHYLNISYCKIRTLTDNEAKEIFYKQNDLEIVDLSGNHLTAISYDIFSGLNNLRYINLAHNALHQGINLQLTSKKIINYIDLSYNSFTEPNGILSRGKIISLNLSHNKIARWANSDVFLCGNAIECIISNVSTSGNITWVDNVDLSHNIISNVTENMTESFRYLKSIDLGNNLIDCSTCYTPGLKAWLRRVALGDLSLKVLNSGKMSEITCAAPLNYSGTPVKDVMFDSRQCSTDFESIDYAIIVGIILGTITAVAILIVLVVYIYRFELTYLMHLVKMKRRRSSIDISLSQKYQYDAFVCYSGEDRSFVIGQLLPRLEQGSGKYQLCLHERDFVLGSFITHNIISSIQNSKFTIVVLSNNFVSSQWCQWELEMANHKLFEDEREFLILLELERLNRNKLPIHLKYLMETRTYLEWPQDGNEKNCEATWRRLEQTLGPSISSSKAA